jgi:peptidoglycan/xylan/chitin deacetylase (PgdA/CDA1 family)
MIDRIKNKLIWEGLYKPKYQKGKKCILMYHGIDQVENRLFNDRFFSADNFEEHLKFYKKNYHVISLTDFFEHKNLDKDKVNVAITFDDGYLNNLKFALPLCEEYSTPATFFITGINNNNDAIIWADLVDICSHYISVNEVHFDNQKFSKNSQGKFPGLKEYIKTTRLVGTSSLNELKDELLSLSKINLNDKKFHDYWELLSPENIRSISKSKFVKVGSHGFHHNNLGEIDIDFAIDEIVKSKVYLESLTQYEVDSIGYPDGSYSQKLLDEAKSIGYRYQCAVDYRFLGDEFLPHLNNRLGLYPPCTKHYINYKIQTF